MNRRTNRLCTAVAVGVAAATVASVAPAAADVRPSDLPTTGQVAAVYPALDGGSREVFRSRTVDTPTRDCLAYRSPVQADSGRWAGYLDADGESVYFKGRTDPTVFVYEFHSRAEARAAFRIVRNHYSRCEGLFRDDDVAFRRTELGLPVVGDARYGFRTRQEDFGISSVDHVVDTYVVTGRRLVNVRAQADRFKPAKGAVVRLTALAVDRAG